jgi:type I restriction enzyme M protein
MPEGYKNFSKTKPMKLEHFAPAVSWWNAREEIIDTEGFFQAKKYSIDELMMGKFNLDLCGFPHEVQEILEPMELLANYHAKKAEADERITKILSEIVSLLERR